MIKDDLKNNILDALVSEINKLKKKENLDYLVKEKVRFFNSLNMLFEIYDNDILDLETRLKTQTIISRQYRSTLSSNNTIITEELNDKHLNLAVVLAILDESVQFLEQHPTNNNIRKMISDIEVVKTYIIINLYSEITRRKELEYFNKSLSSAIDNLTSVFNWMDIDILPLIGWTKKYYYGEQTLYDKFPDLQLKYLKNVNNKGVVSGTFNELFRRSESLLLAEIELRYADEKEKKSKEKSPLLRHHIMITNIEKKFRELDLNQQQAIKFLE